jgi:hypothetical protein
LVPSTAAVTGSLAALIAATIAAATVARGVGGVDLHGDAAAHQPDDAGAGDAERGAG